MGLLTQQLGRLRGRRVGGEGTQLLNTVEKTGEKGSGGVNLRLCTQRKNKWTLGRCIDFTAVKHAERRSFSCVSTFTFAELEILIRSLSASSKNKCGVLAKTSFLLLLFHLSQSSAAASAASQRLSVRDFMPFVSSEIRNQTAGSSTCDSAVFQSLLG